MPFELGAAAPRSIAVIGAGISGMGCAWMLSGAHRITLIDAEPRLGGHARTVVAGKNGDQPVDTGFIVFNYANYPNLAQLFDELDVPVCKSNMSFGVSVGGGRMEYALHGPDALCATRANMARPAFWRMVRDIFRFNARALDHARDNPGLTIGEFLAELKLGPWFRDYYLLPLSGAIWSTPVERIMEFPAHAMMQFFENHALLSHTGQHQWYTVRGGSAEYVRRIEAGLRARGAELRLGAPVQAVRRGLAGPELRMPGGAWERFDEIVFATHSDDTLRLLSDPAPEERAALGAIAYQPNDIVLHADSAVMPRRRKVWASWVYTEDAGAAPDRIDLTYWMNSLQPIPHDDPLFVTLNSRRPIREELIHDQVTLRHPVYDLAALDAQERVRTFNGARNTWFCGAWMRHGFHEDGLASAIDVADGIGRTTPLSVAAE